MLGVVQQCVGMDGVAMHGVGIDGAHKQNVSVENIKKCVRWAGTQAPNPWNSRKHAILQKLMPQLAHAIVARLRSTLGSVQLQQCLSQIAFAFSLCMDTFLLLPFACFLEAILCLKRHHWHITLLPAGSTCRQPHALMHMCWSFQRGSHSHSVARAL